MTDETPHDNPLGDAPALVIGAPCAFSADCDLMTRDDKRRVVGCAACVQCECGQPFRVDLLSEAMHGCPKCKREYTSLLIVARAEDRTVLQDAMEHVLAVNGIDVRDSNPDDGDDDDDDDQDDDDDDDDREPSDDTPHDRNA